MAKIGKADANPTKAFFVRTITKDISLEDCILDLLDNSVDGAWQLEGGHPMTLEGGPTLKKYEIDISANETQFKIVDNCGGITLGDAVDYAFTFGRKDEEEVEQYSIGVYGIGMKRAVFKIGKAISIRSTYENPKNTRESFRVPINTDDWLHLEEWDFDIEETDPLPSTGVEIIVEDLHDAISTAFADPGFIQNLKRIVARDYALHLHRGLTIKLNGDAIQGWQIEMRVGDDFAPMRIQYEDVAGEGKPVSVEIIAGMSAPPPDSIEPDEEFRGENRYGWYVACNGRIVLAANRDAVSGWGTEDWPAWHPQYNGFIGIILFAAGDASLLPLTTTKRSVDGESGVYKRAKPRLRDATKQWINYTNARKQALEENRRLEEQARAASIFAIQIRNTVALPRVASVPRVVMANINYAMPRTKVRALAEGFGNINMSYRDVGITSFEYSYADHVGNE